MYTVVQVYSVTTVYIKYYWRSSVVVVPDKGNSLNVHSFKSAETKQLELTLNRRCDHKSIQD